MDIPTIARGANLNMHLVYPWYNLQQPKISQVYLEVLVYTKDIRALVYAKTQDSRCCDISNFSAHWLQPRNPGRALDRSGIESDSKSEVTTGSVILGNDSEIMSLSWVRRAAPGLPDKTSTL